MTLYRLTTGFGIGVCLLLLGSVAAGCKRSGSTRTGPELFASASPELKAAWEYALAADRTNGYAAAWGTLLWMRHPTKLTPEQLQAINALMDSVTKRVAQAKAKGDPQALEESRKMSKIDKRGIPPPGLEAPKEK
jgi:hypothetical protein